MIFSDITIGTPFRFEPDGRVWYKISDTSAERFFDFGDNEEAIGIGGDTIIFEF